MWGGLLLFTEMDQQVGLWFSHGQAVPASARRGAAARNHLQCIPLTPPPPQVPWAP